MSLPDPLPTLDPSLMAALAVLLANPEAQRALAPMVAAIQQSTAPRTTPTVRDYLPVVDAAATSGTRTTYRTYWNLLVAKHGDAHLDEVPTSALRALALYARDHAVKRRNARDGRSAQENCVGALRAFFRCAVEDGYITKNPAAAVEKPRRLPSQRRALTAQEFEQLDGVTRSGGDDPLLDTLLLRFHSETGARRGGAIALRRKDLDEVTLCVLLHEKGGTSRWQPVSRTLFDALLAHADARGATQPEEQVFRYRPRAGRSQGAPLTRRRYNTLANRWQTALPWAAQYGVSPHWLRHTALTAAERIGGSYGVARAFAGHAVPSDATTTYIKAGLEEVAAVLVAMTGEPHPLAAGGVR